MHLLPQYASPRPVPRRVRVMAALLSADIKRDKPESLHEYLHQWTSARGFQLAGGGSCAAAYLRHDVVVKANYTVAPLDVVPVALRPEQVIVCKADGSNCYSNADVVVQPRYRTTAEIKSAEQYDSSFRLVATLTNPVPIHIDAHAGNWGLRDDDSPVLFDW